MRRGTTTSICVCFGLSLLALNVLIHLKKDGTGWMSSKSYNNVSQDELITRHICNPRQILCERRDNLFDGLHRVDAQELVHRALSKTIHECRNSKVYGNIKYGGYDLCQDTDFALKKDNCTVYSLGVGNRGFTFEQDISQEFGCEIHLFQSRNYHTVLGIDEHLPDTWQYHNISLWGDDFASPDGAEMRRLGTILKELYHENKTIDVLKIDAQGGEWPFLRDLAMNRQILQKVKQLILTINGPRRKPKEQGMRMTDFAQVFRAASTLKRVGFQNWMHHGVDMQQRCCKWWADLTPTKVSGGTEMLCCYQVFMVNAAYFK